LLLLLLSACSGIKAYKGGSEQNLQLRAAAESGSMLSSVTTSVDIYSVDKSCRLQYEGTVALKNGSVTTGIPVGQPSYLVFNFSSSSFLANSSGNATFDALLTPKRGARYEIEASYADDLYDVTVYERASGSRKSREISPGSLSECKPG